MSKKPQKGEVVGITRLKNFYDEYVLIVLSNRISKKDVPRGKRRQFKIVEELPDQDEYDAIRTERYTITVTALVDEAFSDAEGIGEELREWYDSMPENLQYGDRGATLYEAASAFEQLDRPSTPGESDDDPVDVREVAVYYLPDLNAISRPSRAYECAGKLRAVAEQFQGADDRELLGDVWDENGQLKTEIAEWVQELESQADEIECIEIPGMFG